MIPVGFDYEVPDEVELLDEFGGYKVVFDGIDIFIVGMTSFNLTANNISQCELAVVTKSVFENFFVANPEVPHEKTIPGVYFLEDHVHYYMVTYFDRSFIFEELFIALNFMAMIIQVKERGLL